MELIHESVGKKLYRDGDRLIKSFDESYSKAGILNEALNQARVEETGLNIPKVLGVTVVDGRWSLIWEYIEGETLESLGIAPQLSTTAEKMSEPGDYPITFPEDATASTTNYNITYAPGTLKVTDNATAIVVKAKDANKDYDGKPLTQGEFEVSGQLAERVLRG